MTDIEILYWYRKGYEEAKAGIDRTIPPGACSIYSKGADQWLYLGQKELLLSDEEILKRIKS